MTFLDLARKRCSIRAYQPAPVSQELIDAIVEAGRVAPTAANRQPVRIVCATSATSLAHLGEAANLHGAPLAFVVCVDGERAWKRRADGWSSAEVDASIVTDHMMLAAADLGLGSVWICNFDPAIVRKACALPPSLEPVNILAVGHAACDPTSPDRHATERIPASEFVVNG